MKKKTLIVAALIAALGVAESASAQWFRFVYCQRCAASRAVQTRGCDSCAGGVCLADPVGREADPAVEYKPEPPKEVAPCDPVAPCEAVENCGGLTDLETALVNEIIRVRGSGLLKLRLDASCLGRARQNAATQASYCRLGHFTGDPNEVAGRGYTSARAAVSGWLNSPAHRAILLRSNYKTIGASVRRGRDGFLYWSVNFGY